MPLDIDNLRDQLASHNEFCGIGEAIILVNSQNHDNMRAVLAGMDAPPQVLVDDNLTDDQYRLVCGLPAHDERIYPSGIAVPVEGEQSIRRAEIMRDLAAIAEANEKAQRDARA